MGHRYLPRPPTESVVTRRNKTNERSDRKARCSPLSNLVTGHSQQWSRVNWHEVSQSRVERNVVLIKPKRLAIGPALSNQLQDVTEVLLYALKLGIGTAKPRRQHQFPGGDWSQLMLCVVRLVRYKEFSSVVRKHPPDRWFGCRAEGHIAVHAGTTERHPSTTEDTQEAASGLMHIAQHVDGCGHAVTREYILLKNRAVGPEWTQQRKCGAREQHQCRRQQRRDTARL